jgi:hypothetical protein
MFDFNCQYDDSNDNIKYEGLDLIIVKLNKLKYDIDRNKRLIHTSANRLNNIIDKINSISINTSEK